MVNNPMKNVMILTGGLAGSSALTGLVARAGFWTGDDTFKKKDYNTYENQKLIDLNRKLLADVEYKGRYEHEFSRQDIDYIESRGRALDLSPYREFVAECAAHEPWIWKDPRLWLTIRVWKDLLDLDNIKFIILSRDSLQGWISTTIRRQIQTREYARRYNDGIINSLVDFMNENRCSYIQIVYEDLLVHPESTIELINGHLGTALNIDDLKAIYRGELYRKPKGLADLIKAYFIYFKNFAERYR